MKNTLSNRVLVCGMFIISIVGLSTAYLPAQTPFGDSAIKIDLHRSDISELTPGRVFIDNSLASYTENLSIEEKKLLKMKLLPAYYPVLKQCLDSKKPYAGKKGGLKASIVLCKSYFPQAKGHFSNDFGNAEKMLEWANRVAADEKLCKLVLSTQPGDVILSGPLSEESVNSDFICLMTKGPYYHATIVTEAPPPVIIEAMGATSQKNDPCKNKVRMTMWYEEFDFYKSLRLVRPADGMDSASAARITNQALSYAHGQLGKPYDYSFSDGDGSKAFYCSELVSKAYESAGHQIASKDANRDKLVVAIHAVIDGMEPLDKYALSDKIMHFAIQYGQEPNLDLLQDFMVNTLVPGCKIFADAFPDIESRAKLSKMINKIRSGEAFSNFDKATRDYSAKKAAGKFDAGFGIGLLKEKAAQVSVGASLLKDINKLAKDAGTTMKETLIITAKVFLPIYKNLGTYGEILSGLGKEGLELPAGIKTVMSIVSWAVDKRDTVKDWPIIGGTLANLMPGNGDGKTRTDFTSPSDLANTSPDYTFDWP